MIDPLRVKLSEFGGLLLWLHLLALGLFISRVAHGAVDADRQEDLGFARVLLEKTAVCGGG